MGTNQEDFAYSGKPRALHGWYMLTSTNGDRIHLIALLTNQAIGIDGGAADITIPTTVYREFAVNLQYANTTIDAARISIAIQPDTASMTPHLGTYAFIDSLYFGRAVTGVEQIDDIAALEPCSPQPSQ